MLAAWLPKPRMPRCRLAAAATPPYIVTSSTNLTGSVSANALLIVGSNIAISGNSSASLTLAAGTLAATGTGNTVSVPSVVLGAEGVL